MIVGLCIAEQIFAIPDSHFLASVEIVKPWIGEHKLWRVQSIARKIIPPACTNIYQSWGRINAFVPGI
jgi:hypothetical protein